MFHILFFTFYHYYSIFVFVFIFCRFFIFYYALKIIIFMAFVLKTEIILHIVEFYTFFLRFLLLIYFLLCLFWIVFSLLKKRKTKININFQLIYFIQHTSIKLFFNQVHTRYHFYYIFSFVFHCNKILFPGQQHTVLFIKKL